MTPTRPNTKKGLAIFDALPSDYFSDIPVIKTIVGQGSAPARAASDDDDDSGGDAMPGQALPEGSEAKNELRWNTGTEQWEAVASVTTIYGGLTRGG